MPAPFFDTHTHQHRSQNPGILHVYAHKLPGDIPATGYFSAGIHPWYSNPDSDAQCLLWVENALGHPRCVAVGETGLDRLKGPAWHWQLQLFEAHITLANAAEKPLIVHCVKAWQDLIQLHKQLRPVTPWIYHGFRGNFSAMQALLSQGILLSFGEALLQSTRLQLVIAQMPRGCFLLETDTGNTTIEAIYNSAARARQVSTETLQEQIWETAIKVFPGIVRG